MRQLKTVGLILMTSKAGQSYIQDYLQFTCTVLITLSLLTRQWTISKATFLGSKFETVVMTLQFRVWMMRVASLLLSPSGQGQKMVAGHQNILACLLPLVRRKTSNLELKITITLQVILYIISYICELPHKRIFMLFIISYTDYTK